MLKFLISKSFETAPAGPGPGSMLQMGKEGTGIIKDLQDIWYAPGREKRDKERFRSEQKIRGLQASTLKQQLRTKEEERDRALKIRNLLLRGNY